MCWVTLETQKCLHHQKLIPEVVSIWPISKNWNCKIPGNIISRPFFTRFNYRSVLVKFNIVNKQSIPKTKVELYICLKRVSRRTWSCFSLPYSFSRIADLTTIFWYFLFFIVWFVKRTLPIELNCSNFGAPLYRIWKVVDNVFHLNIEIGLNTLIFNDL